MFSSLRLGPSASEAALHAAEDAKMVELVANLQKVKLAVDDPSLKLVLQAVAPQLLTLFPRDDDESVQDAEKGLPAPSRPKKRTRSEKPVPTASAPPKVSPSVAPAPVEAPPAATSPSLTSPNDSLAGGLSGENPEGVKEPTINSSSHRAEHARLARRMERIDPSEFPNMAKLWSGTRKDWFDFFICIGTMLKCYYS